MRPRRGATSLVRDRSCFSHLMPTHGSWVHVTYLKNVATILLHSAISTAYTVVKVVFGIDREYVHIRSRSLCEPIVIITHGYRFKTIYQIYFELNHLKTKSLFFLKS